MDSSLILRQLRKSRENKIEIGKHRFLYRRPTDVEMLKLGREKASDHDIAREFVEGWENVTPADIVPSGGSDSLEFDRILWREWLADRPDFWNPIAEAVVADYRTHVEKREQAAKN